MNPIHTSVLAISLSAIPVAAQNTFIVSATPGPDVDFADLPAAVTVAAAGDEVMLRPGLYTPATFNRGILVRGAPGVAFKAGAFRVQSIPAGEQMVLQGLDLSVDPGGVPGFPPPRITIAQSQGAVLLQDVDIRISTGRQAPMSCNQSPRVALTGCDLTGFQAISIVDGNIAFSDCTIGIADPGTGTQPNLGVSAMSILVGNVSLAGCTVTAPGGQNLFMQPIPVIQVGGNLRIGGPNTVVKALGAAGVSAPIPCIQVISAPAGGTSALVDPAVTMTPANGGAEFSTTTLPPGSRVGRARVPGSVLRSTPLGDVLELSGPADEMWFQFCGPVTWPVVTSVGMVWADHRFVTVLGMGSYDAQGSAVLPLPPVPAGMSMVMTSQTLVFSGGRTFVGMPTVAFCN